MTKVNISRSMKVHAAEWDWIAKKIDKQKETKVALSNTAANVTNTLLVRP